ncbi:Transposase, ISXO2-like domain-containing protein [Meloidogyne graminicola]|uniref:Transposase, ISXO2-like domain-containing protein n=1 Tax=Meloidogyne graminicola TaxID=189291 RepID=A0A8S9ZST4_9BILA|nr:Transposase, ISXO2-like domain-containing protein [Meloidogyne graminicola]
MKLYLGKRNLWQCNTVGCRQQFGLRSGNWFSNTKLPFLKIVRFIYCWSEDLTSIAWCEKQLELSQCTTIDWNNYLREVCVAVLNNKKKQPIGGNGRIVEIDESLFSKRKNNSGRILPQMWIFGGICRETKECFLVIVPDRSANTLLSFIKDNIATGSTIYSDSWKGYITNEIEEAGFQHFKVNHQYNFIDPTSGCHTQTIERMWARHHMESYFAEFMWKKMIGDGDIFEEVMRAWEKYWTLE